MGVVTVETEVQVPPLLAVIVTVEFFEIPVMVFPLTVPKEDKMPFVAFDVKLI